MGGGGGEGSLRSCRNFFGPLFLEFLDPPLGLISWPWDGKATKRWWWNQRFRKSISQQFLALCLTLIKYKLSSWLLHRSSTILLFHILFCNFKTSVVVDFSMMLKTCQKVRVSLNSTITLVLVIATIRMWKRPGDPDVNTCYIFQRTNLWLAVTCTDDYHMSSLNASLISVHVNYNWVNRGQVRIMAMVDYVSTWQWQKTCFEPSWQTNYTYSCRADWYSGHYKGRNLDSRTTILKDHASRLIYYSRITAVFLQFCRFTLFFGINSRITRNPFQTLCLNWSKIAEIPEILELCKSKR